MAGFLGYLMGAGLGLFAFLGITRMFFISPVGLVLEVPLALVLYVCYRRRIHVAAPVALAAILMGYLTSGWLINAFINMILSECP